MLGLLVSRFIPEWFGQPVLYKNMNRTASRDQLFRRIRFYRMRRARQRKTNDQAVGKTHLQPH